MSARTNWKSVRSLVVTCAALSATAGCVPVPHVHRRASDLHVRVVQGGDSLRGVVVKRVLAWGSDNCALGGDEVITDGLGMVHFPSRYEFRGLVILYGDPIDPMVLCVYRNAELVGAAEFTLMGGAPERMEVECDLDLLAALGQSRFCGSPSWIDEKRREMATARHSS